MGWGKKKDKNSGTAAVTDLGRMMVGKATVEEEIIEKKLNQQHQQQLAAQRAEREAVAQVGEKARIMSHNVSELRQKCADLDGELERA